MLLASGAEDGLNRLTRNSPHFVLEADLGVNATFHLCRGANLMAVNRADFCGGGFMGTRVGLSHEKGGNHNVV